MKEAGSPFEVQPYGGPVVDVQLSRVIVRLHENFPDLPDRRWDVRFMVNRLLLRRMHDAIGKGHIHNRILFPDESHRRPARDLPSPDFTHNRNVASNPRQSLAIARIMAQSQGDIPFIIFGP